MMNEQYIKIGEAARRLKTDVQYLHKLVRQQKIGARCEQRGLMKYWYIDTQHPRYLQLAGRLNKPKEAVPTLPKKAHDLDWSLWEAMCRAGEEIVEDRLSESTLREYKRYITLFFKQHAVLNRDTLRAALSCYESRVTSERDYYTARRMLHQAMMTVARYYVYNGAENKTFLESLRYLRPKRGNTTVSRPCHTEKTIREAVSTLSKAKTKKGQKAFNAYNELLNQTIIEIAFYTGARSGELCGIRLSDIDFANHSLRLFGKGSKQRYVGICESLDAVLQKYLTERPKTSSPYLLLSEWGKPMKPGYISRRFRRLRKYMNNENFKPHSVRRTAITWMLTEKKMPVTIVRDAVGHSSLSVTNLYAQPTANDVIEQMRKM